MGTRLTRPVYKNGNLVIRDSDLSPSASIWDDCPLQAMRQDPSVGFLWEDHFHWYTTAYGYTTTADAGSTATVSSTSAYGILNLANAAAGDNEEVYVASTATLFLPAAGKDLWFEARCAVTEINIDDANALIGLSSVSALGTLADNGAGTVADYAGATFYKVDGGTVWQCETSTDAGAGAATTNTSCGAVASGTYRRFGIKATGATKWDFYLDGVQVFSSIANVPAVALKLIFGSKNGGATAGGDTLSVDWMRVAQLA